jgi:anaphase-promoting complex subunit 8
MPIFPVRNQKSFHSSSVLVPLATSGRELYRLAMPGAGRATASGMLAGPIAEFPEAVRHASFACGLRTAQTALAARGLVHASRWAAEFLQAIPPRSAEEEDASAHRRSCDDHPLLAGVSQANPDDTYRLAKAYFDSKQYRRCAGLLTRARERARELTDHPEAADATFLRCYAQYLSAEKDAALDGVADSASAARAAADLHRLRADLAVEDDPHCLYLLAVINSKLELGAADGTVRQLLTRSVAAFPWNWDAWKRLAVTVADADEASVVVEEVCQQNSVQDCSNSASEEETARSIARLCIGVLFWAWTSLENDGAEGARQVYTVALEVLESSIHIKGCLASSLYHMRLFDEAQVLFEEIFAEDEYCLEGVDTYSNILYVKEDKVRLSVLAHRCVKVDKYCVETCCVIGNYYSLRGQHEQAVSYFQRALKLNRSYLSAWTLMGHEYVEMKNTAAAVEAYRRAVDVSPKDFRAWYGLGQTYELLDMPLYTLFYYSKAAALRPRDARMWCAVGQTLEELARLPDAVRAYERMNACDDREGLALSKLASLYERMARESPVDCAQYTQMAAHYYGQNLARRDTEGMGGAETAAALRFLSGHAVAQRRYADAEQLCIRLLDYAAVDKDCAKNLLREIHANRDER